MGFALHGCAMRITYGVLIYSLYLVFVISRCPNIKSIDIGANNDLTDESMIKIILQNPLMLLEEFHCERNSHFREFYLGNFPLKFQNLYLIVKSFCLQKLLKCSVYKIKLNIEAVTIKYLLDPNPQK